MTPWFPFFGRDFLAATTGWTAEERGHYLTLLIVQWEQGSLPDDSKRLELISPGLRAHGRRSRTSSLYGRTVGGGTPAWSMRGRSLTRGASGLTSVRLPALGLRLDAQR